MGYASGGHLDHPLRAQPVVLKTSAASVHRRLSRLSLLEETASVGRRHIRCIHPTTDRTGEDSPPNSDRRGLNLSLDEIPALRSTGCLRIQDDAIERDPELVTMTTPLSARSLTSPLDMNRALTEDPGSPPDLTDSQTSPSNSNSDSDKSRPSSPPNVKLANMNFEDITLDETGADGVATPTNWRKARGGDKENIMARRSTTTKRPVLATLQTQPSRYLRAVENGVQSASTLTTRRAFTSANPLPRTTSVAPPFTAPIVQRRSATCAAAPAPSRDKSTRRSSWHAVRKTVKQLEAEYHDSDDELPDDASLFNVPLSPLPGQDWSATSRPRGSPSRVSCSRSVSPGPIPLGHARTAPEPAPPRRSSLRSASSGNRLPRVDTRARARLVPPKLGVYRDASAKSWTRSMADLDHEARIIAEKLEYHTNTDLETLHRASAPSVMPLPAIQRGTLDFMPASKEKQAILSRTRPSWLPPKDPKEEAKHLKQYEKIVQAAQEAERKREEKFQQHLRQGSEGTRDSLHKIWTFYVDPTTDLAVIDRRINDLCWRGIPPPLRGRVWKRAIGNLANLTHDDFSTARDQVHAIKVKTEEELSEREQELRDRFVDIERDAETIFPELKLFGRDGPLWTDLTSVCEAYIIFQPEHQYCFGILLLSSILLLQFSDAADTFTMLANTLHKLAAIPFHITDATSKDQRLTKTYQRTQSLLQRTLPRLHTYLSTPESHNGLGLPASFLLEPLFFSLFSNGLDAEHLSRIFDIWFFKGDAVLIATAVAVFQALQSQIFGVQGDARNRRDKIGEMLGWGPYSRLDSGYFDLAALSEVDAFIGAIQNLTEDIR